MFYKIYIITIEWTGQTNYLDRDIRVDRKIKTFK